MKLAKAGYYGGNPDAVLEAPLNTVLAIIQYENFTRDVESAFRDLNQGES